MNKYSREWWKENIQGLKDRIVFAEENDLIKFVFSGIYYTTDEIKQLISLMEKWANNINIKMLHCGVSLGGTFTFTYEYKDYSLQEKTLKVGYIYTEKYSGDKYLCFYKHNCNIFLCYNISISGGYTNNVYKDGKISSSSCIIGAILDLDSEEKQ